MAENARKPPVASQDNVELETEYVVIRDEEYNQLLDEWAEIVYCHLCQLSEKALVTETLLPILAERNVTNDR